jgi:hypothetical protein
MLFVTFRWLEILWLERVLLRRPRRSRAGNKKVRRFGRTSY